MQREMKDMLKTIEPHCNKDMDEEIECIICNEPLEGKVELKCGHKMCPECFANHSRVNNTCPFCRDEFAPKVKKQLAKISNPGSTSECNRTCVVCTQCK